MKLMIHTIQVGDVLTMVGPDGERSEVFTLAEVPGLRSDAVWIYREWDAPIVVDRTYGLDSTFVLHDRPGVTQPGTGSSGTGSSGTGSSGTGSSDSGRHRAR